MKKIIVLFIALFSFGIAVNAVSNRESSQTETSAQFKEFTQNGVKVSPTHNYVNIDNNNTYDVTVTYTIRDIRPGKGNRIVKQDTVDISAYCGRVIAPYEAVEGIALSTDEISVTITVRRK